MKISLISFLFCIFLYNADCQSKSNTKASLVGRIYRDLGEFDEFKGYKEQRGTLIDPVTETGNYGLSVYAKSGYYIVVFDWSIPSEKVKYKLLDILRVGPIKPQQDIILTMCRLNEKHDSQIIALVKTNNSEYFKTIYKAWRANKKTGRFEAISTKGIDCLNDGYGLD
jgi:hypothetical protein